MVRYPHSWMAAGRAPLVLCTHSGSLKRTNDKGERCWEIMQEGGKVEGWDSGSGFSAWSGPVWGTSDALQGVLGLGEGLPAVGHSHSRHLKTCLFHLPFLCLSTLSSCGTQVRTQLSHVLPCDSTFTTLNPFTHAQIIHL